MKISSTNSAQIYTLPQLTFIGGATEPFEFPFWYGRNKDDREKTLPFNIKRCKVFFSLTYDEDLDGTPVLEKLCDIKQNAEGIYCIATTELTPEDTANLNGVFTYQLTIFDYEKKVAVRKGEIDIQNNIAKDLIARESG